MSYLPKPESKHFSFQYDGKEFSTTPEVKKLSEGAVTKYELTYTGPDGLVVTEYYDFYTEYNAARWVLYFENKGSEKTKQISHIKDADFRVTMNENYIPVKAGFTPSPSGCALVYRMNGSTWSRDEYNRNAAYLRPNDILQYACEGGRSAQGLAPYFEVTEGERSLLFAIGWSGQWNAQFDGIGSDVRIQTGLEDCDFYLNPGEKVRTSSFVVLSCEEGRERARILFRRLFKEHFSLIGQPGRPKQGPLAMNAWGSLPSDQMIKRIRKAAELDLGFEYYWIDAGWYGHSQEVCENEHIGDWSRHTGSWNINTKYHPDELLKVAKAIKESGMKFLLWIEPERVLRDTDSPKANPDWYFSRDSKDDTLILNLGNEQALAGTYEMIAGLIEKLELKCYRQDFNTDPLPFWRANEEPNRKGMNEIKHISGLYRLWDMLLAKFPDLIIDNCASGGRRNDIELLSRSIPLWRSDYQCWFDVAPEVAQIHNSGISEIIPYSGTGLGTIIGDKYTIRSGYSASLAVGYWTYLGYDFEKEQLIEFLREIFAEYKRVRPYFSCDYYPLMLTSLCDTSWTAWQFDRPEQNDGIVMLFRRPESPMETAVFSLHGLEKNARYRFVNADEENEKASFILTGEQAQLFRVTIEKKRDSRLFTYTKI